MIAMGRVYDNFKKFLEGLELIAKNQKETAEIWGGVNVKRKEGCENIILTRQEKQRKAIRKLLHKLKKNDEGISTKVKDYQGSTILEKKTSCGEQ